jgi:hypothetical protein
MIQDEFVVAARRTTANLFVWVWAASSRSATVLPIVALVPRAAAEAALLRADIGAAGVYRQTMVMLSQLQILERAPGGPHCRCAGFCIDRLPPTVKHFKWTVLQLLRICRFELVFSTTKYTNVSNSELYCFKKKRAAAL